MNPRQITSVSQKEPRRYKAPEQFLVQRQDQITLLEKLQAASNPKQDESFSKVYVTDAYFPHYNQHKKIISLPAPQMMPFTSCPGQIPALGSTQGATSAASEHSSFPVTLLPVCLWGSCVSEPVTLSVYLFLVLYSFRIYLQTCLSLLVLCPFTSLTLPSKPALSQSDSVTN